MTRWTAAAALAGCVVEPATALPPVEYVEDLAADIPMTGAADPLFAEVDTVMRQFMKWRCVGAGTLAISYKGRRIYKRGFGRMHGRASEVLHPGCGDDASNPFDPAAAITPADAPMYLGSVSKPITAAVARWLVDERLASACDEPPCPTATRAALLDPALDLLPADLAAVARGDVPVPVQIAQAPCTAGHDPRYADPRWRTITIGNLISHQSGLVRNAIPYATGWSVISNLAALRGYADAGEAPWIAEDAAVRAANAAIGAELDAAAAWLSARNDGAPVYFVRDHPPAATPLDETFALSAGLCLDYTPGKAGKYVEEGLYDPIDATGEYSNFGVTILGRVIDHLQQARTGGAFLPGFGAPETHEDSALAEFIAVKLELDAGVETAEGILALGSTYPDPPAHPVPRIWSGDSFYPTGADEKAPYCVFRDGACDFGAWLAIQDGDTALRPDLTYALRDATRGFHQGPLWTTGYYCNNAAGGLISELPVYLEFARRYNISGRSDRVDNGNGSERVGPLKTTQGHTGSLSGGYAVVQQLLGGPRLRELPPIVDGHLVDDFDHLQQVFVTRPGDVDFVVAVNQNGDPRCTSRLGDQCGAEYPMLAVFLEYGLSLVDWAAVDRMLAAQRDEVVGMAVDDDATDLWFADDRHLTSPGPPDAFPGRDGLSALPYALPSTRIGPDVLGVARDPDGRVVAWYDDGRYSVGDARDLASVASPLRFTAGAHAPTDVVAVAIAADGTAHAWYGDGTWSAGTADDLAAAAAGAYTLPPGRAPADIAAIAFDPADVVWTRFRDGATAPGTVTGPGAPP